MSNFNDGGFDYGSHYGVKAKLAANRSDGIMMPLPTFFHLESFQQIEFCLYSYHYSQSHWGRTFYVECSYLIQPLFYWKSDHSQIV